jgi:hypothetical protein
LDKLSEKLKTEIDLVEKLKEESIRKLGVVDEQGNYSIPLRINEKFNDKDELLSYDVNPTFLEYQSEFEKLINQEVEIEYNAINLEDINIRSEVYPRILFKLTKQS